MERIYKRLIDFCNVIRTLRCSNSVLRLRIVDMNYSSNVDFGFKVRLRAIRDGRSVSFENGCQMKPKSLQVFIDRSMRNADEIISVRSVRPHDERRSIDRLTDLTSNRKIFASVSYETELVMTLNGPSLLN